MTENSEEKTKTLAIAAEITDGVMNFEFKEHNLTHFETLAILDCIKDSLIKTMRVQR